MTCASFGSSSEVSLYYAVDPDPTSDMPADTAWKPVPYTSESLDAVLSSTVSDQITDTRSYANSKLTQGEISGSFSYEAFAGSFLENMLIAVLQADKALHIVEDTRDWDDTQTIQNGSVKKCFAFLKRVRLSNGNYDMFLFRGCQIGSLSMTMDAGALITGDIAIMGTGLGEPEAEIDVYKNIADPTAPQAGHTWTFEAYPSSDLMSGVDSLKDFLIKDGTGTDTGITAQSVSMTIDNAMRSQFAVGRNTIYASGVASGRITVTFSVSAYYASPAVFESFINDDNMSVTFKLLDSSDIGFNFEAAKVKVTSGSTPLAGGPDTDLLISTEMQAFQDSTKGTLEVTLDLTS